MKNTVFLGENVIQITKMQSSVTTNLHIFSILFYNKSQKWKILATLGLFWFMHSGCTAGCIQKSVDSSLCLIGLIVFLQSLMVVELANFYWISQGKLAVAPNGNQGTMWNALLWNSPSDILLIQVLGEPLGLV